MREETDAMKRKERNHTADTFGTINAREGALISFSGMETVLALFSQPGAFVSFVGTKERGSALQVRCLQRLGCPYPQPLFVSPLNLGEKTLWEVERRLKHQGYGNGNIFEP